jgi:hypothetical protein
VILADKLPTRVLDRSKKHRLPTGGEHPFIPKVRTNRRGQPDLVTAPVKHGPKKGQKGFLDSEGRIWIRDPAHAGYPDHWDVQEDEGREYFRGGR